MAKPRIGVIVGSTREGRFADHPAKWITDNARARDDIEAEVLDLRDYPMPFFDEPISPGYGPSKNEVAQRWQKKIAGMDGFIVLAAEYNRGPTAVLKNALDWASRPFPLNALRSKPVAVVGDAVASGANIAHQVHAAIGFTYEHALHFAELVDRLIQHRRHLERPFLVLHDGHESHGFVLL